MNLFLEIYYLRWLFVFADHRPHGRQEIPAMIPRSDSTSEFQPLEDKEVEYFFASDASAVIEHTNRVIFLEVHGKHQLYPGCG